MMSPRTAKRSPAASREDILEAARSCFTETGYHLTKVDDIASRAGLSKGAVYWHFENKRELFLALLDVEIDHMRGVLESGAEAADAPTQIQQISQAFIVEMPHMLPVIEFTLEYLAQASRDPELRERLASMYRLFVDAASGFIRRGVDEGSFRTDVDPDHAAGVLVAALDGIFLQKVVLPEIDLPAMWLAAEELFLRGMLEK